MTSARWIGLAVVTVAVVATTAGCGFRPQVPPIDPVGTWQLDSDERSTLSLYDDGTFDAQDLPRSLACDDEVIAASPPGCGDPTTPVTFSGTWRLSEEHPERLFLLHDDVRFTTGYRADRRLGFHLRTLDVPEPDLVFVQEPEH